jgi:type IV pilin-like protein
VAGHADAHRFAIATNLVRDMAERIRANPRAGALYTTSPGDVEHAGCNTPEPCDIAQRAAADVAEFFRAAQALPAGATAIEYEPAIGPAAVDRYAITVRWRGMRDDDVVTLHVLAPPVAG